MRTVKISRRAFLTGLGLASTAALLSACNTVPASSDSGAAPSVPDAEEPASSAASEVPAQPILSVDEFPITDGSTACIPADRTDHGRHPPGWIWRPPGAP